MNERHAERDISADARSSMLVRALSAALSTILVAASVAWAADFYRPMGLVLFMEQFVAGILALGLLLLYLSVPATSSRPRMRPAWYDVVAGVLGFAAAGYIAVRYPVLGDLVFFRPLDGVIASVIVIVLVIEGLRRTTGWPLVIISIVFFIYGVWGDLVPGTLSGRASDPVRLALYLALDANAMLGTPMIVVSTIVIAFVLFGNLLNATGGSVFFTDISMALMGRYRGGSAKIAVTGSALFGSISGSAVSNVVSTGVVTIPMMRKAGYAPHQAAAIEAVASTGGQLMPPVMGAAAFLIAEFLQISYAEVVMAALLPSILYFAALFIVADLEAAKRGIARVEEELIPRALVVLARGGHFMIPFVVLIYALFWMNERPETAALYASGTLIVLSVIFGYGGKRPGLRDLFDAVRGTGHAVLDIIMIGCAAGFVIGVLSVSGLGSGLTQWLVSVARDNLALLLLLSAFVSIVLGMGMPTVGVYVLLAALVAPALVKIGIEPLAAHLFVMYFGMMSMITPPVAIAAFAAASLAQTDPMRTALEAMRFGWIAYIIPFLFVYSPTLILMGGAADIAFAIATALGGVWFISAGVVGYSMRPIGLAERAAYAIAGFLLLTPAGLYEGAIMLDFAGIALAILLVVRELVQVRRRRIREARPETV